MRFLLDSHSFLWAGTDPSQLPTSVRDLLSDPANRAVLSVVTPWELAIKIAAGKLVIPAGLAALLTVVVSSLGIEILRVESDHALKIESLPVFPDHKDPFDRMLVAQALVEGLPIVSKDRKFARYGVEVIW